MRLLRVIGGVAVAGAVVFGIVRWRADRVRNERCAALIADDARMTQIMAEHLLRVADSEARVLPAERKVSPADAAESEARIRSLHARAAALERYRAALRPTAPLPDRKLIDPADRSVVKALYEGPRAAACADLFKGSRTAP